MKNGREKQMFILGLINLFRIEDLTIRETYEKLKGMFYIVETFIDTKHKLHCKQVPVSITYSCFETSINVLRLEQRINARKEITPRSGSKAPIYIISFKEKTKHEATCETS